MNSPPSFAPLRIPPLCFAKRGRLHDDIYKTITLYSLFNSMKEYKKFDLNKIKIHARELRKEMTDPEKILWNELRGRKIEGYKFLRQHPILYKGNLIRYNYFIADFYCAEKKVIIELDGPIHDYNKEYDEFRDYVLKELDMNILRIKNEELYDIKYAIEKIKNFLNLIH
jgi:very-short-patch-repair endonuclease